MSAGVERDFLDGMIALARKDFPRAEQRFRRILASDPRGARRAWRFSLNFGIVPDTNINSATDKDRVNILGLPFVLNPSAQARSGTGIVAGGETHRCGSGATAKCRSTSPPMAA